MAGVAVQYYCTRFSRFDSKIEEGEKMRRLQLPGYFSPIALLTVILLVCTALPMWGQSGTLGTVTGVVTDPSNAVVPDATVSLKEKSTNTVQTSTTNSAGRYTFL